MTIGRRHWWLAEDTDVEILSIIDDHSRLAITTNARATFTAVDIVGAFGQDCGV
jgi:hypothetical protein